MKTSSSEIPPCDLCNSNQSKLLYSKVKDYRHRMTNEDFVIVKCKKCSLVFTAPRPNNEEITSYYPSKYDSKQDANKTLFFYYRRLKFYLEAKSIERKLPESSDQPKALFVGPGSGEFMSYLRGKELFSSLEGIEMDEDLTNQAKRDFHLNVRHGNIRSEELGEEKYDLVTFRHSLEHIHSPKLALKKTAKALRPGGLIFLKFPNRKSQQEKKFGKFWDGYNIPRHLYHFDESIIRRYLRSSGFQVDSVIQEMAPQEALRSQKHLYSNQEVNEFINLIYYLPQEIINKLLSRSPRLIVYAKKPTQDDPI